MPKPILGGNGPAVDLFHYGAAPQGAIRRGSYWTDFDSTNKNDISRVTGQAAIYFKYRTAVRVNRAVLETYFNNVATSMKPGLGAFFEYRNKVDIAIAYLDTSPLP